MYLTGWNLMTKLFVFAVLFGTSMTIFGSLTSGQVCVFMYIGVYIYVHRCVCVSLNM